MSTKRIGLKVMGLEPVPKLTKAVCNKRVTAIVKTIEAGKLKGEALRKARKMAAWYRWRANQGAKSA